MVFRNNILQRATHLLLFAVKGNGLGDFVLENVANASRPVAIAIELKNTAMVNYVLSSNADQIWASELLRLPVILHVVNADGKLLTADNMFRTVNWTQLLNELNGDFRILRG